MPTVPITVAQATEIGAAIRPYSIAVAPIRAQRRHPRRERKPGLRHRSPEQRDQGRELVVGEVGERGHGEPILCRDARFFAADSRALIDLNC